MDHTFGIGRRGGFVVHVGAPIVMLALFTIFVIVSLTAPDVANQITAAVSDLSMAAQGIAP